MLSADKETRGTAFLLLGGKGVVLIATAAHVLCGSHIQHRNKYRSSCNITARGLLEHDENWSCRVRQDFGGGPDIPESDLALLTCVVAATQKPLNKTDLFIRALHPINASAQFPPFRTPVAIAGISKFSYFYGFPADQLRVGTEKAVAMIFTFLSNLAEKVEPVVIATEGMLVEGTGGTTLATIVHSPHNGSTLLTEASFRHGHSGGPLITKGCVVLGVAHGFSSSGVFASVKSLLIRRTNPKDLAE